MVRVEILKPLSHIGRELWENRLFVLLVLTLIPISVMGWRVSWFDGPDWYAGSNMLLGIALALVIFACAGVYEAATKLYWKRIAHVVAITAFVWIGWVTYKACSYLGAPGFGVWVIAETGQTSLNHDYLALPRHEVKLSYLPISLSLPRAPFGAWHVPNQVGPISAGVETTTMSEGVTIPLWCSVRADGIYLDQRDAGRLERYLLSTATTREPLQVMRSNVVDALSKSALAVLASKSIEDIERQRTWAIPVQIGTPLADTLTQNLMRWRNGDIYVTCGRKRFQS